MERNVVYSNATTFTEMKQRPVNTEMDLLLRRFARHDDARASAMRGKIENDGGTQGIEGGAHLDADELNAYAENALPPSARARYAGHLADCERCRKIITELALASNVAGELEKRTLIPETSQTGSWWQRVTGFMTLPVVRYGLPVLALALIAGIIFIAMRPRQDNELVARNEGPSQSTAAVQQERDDSQPSESTATEGIVNENSTANSNVGPSPAAKQQSTVPSTSGTVLPRKEPEVQTNASANPARPADRGQSGPVPPASVSREVQPDQTLRAGKAGGVFQSQPSLSAPEPPSSSTVQTEESNTVVKADAPKLKVEESRDESRPAYGGAANSTTTNNSTANVTDKAAVMEKHAPATLARRRSSRAPAASSGTRAENKDAPVFDMRANETRSVGGRTFRRQGSAWVDTAYNSSRSTINVARGSEQYRALVADEPGLRTIADQLGGEVIVVWKGHAYRIR